MYVIFCSLYQNTYWLKSHAKDPFPFRSLAFTYTYRIKTLFLYLNNLQPRTFIYLNKYCVKNQLLYLWVIIVYRRYMHVRQYIRATKHHCCTVQTVLHMVTTRYKSSLLASCATKLWHAQLVQSVMANSTFNFNKTFTSLKNSSSTDLWQPPTTCGYHRFKLLL